MGVGHMIDKLLSLGSNEKRNLGQRLQRWVYIAIASIIIVAFMISPLQQPLGTLTLAASMSFLAWLAGLDSGIRRRRYLPLKGSGLRGSESFGSHGNQQLYKTNDITGASVEYTLDAVMNCILEALETQKGRSQHNQTDLSSPEDRWPGTWVYLTCDSREKPVVIDLNCLFQMLVFLNNNITDEVWRVKVRHAVSGLSERSIEAWEAVLDS